MPTLVTKTVKPSGGDYTSLAAAEAGLQANLVTADQQLTIECYTLAGADGPVTVDGWTTDATRYIHIVVPLAARHNGTYRTDRYRIEGSNVGAMLDIFEAYTYIEGLQGKCTLTTSMNGWGAIIESTANNCRASHGIWWGVLNGVGTANMFGFWFLANDPQCWNWLCYDIRNDPNTGNPAAAFFHDQLNPSVARVYNCTAINCYYGFWDGSGFYEAKNCLAVDCFDGFFGPFNDFLDTHTGQNMSDINGDAPAVQPLEAVTGTPTFVNYAADDFRLSPLDTVAQFSGQDLMNNEQVLQFSDDIAGNLRQMPWSIGAHQPDRPLLPSMVPVGDTVTNIGF